MNARYGSTTSLFTVKLSLCFKGFLRKLQRRQSGCLLLATPQRQTRSESVSAAYRRQCRTKLTDSTRI